MPRESLTAPKRSDIDELKTIQMLEETIGPKTLRQLRFAFSDEASRRILESVARGASDDLRELDDLVLEWARVEGTPHASPPIHEEGLDRAEILSSIVELKESEAKMMRRAAEDAPSERLRERLLHLAARQEGAAEKLKSLL